MIASSAFSILCGARYRQAHNSIHSRTKGRENTHARTHARTHAHTHTHTHLREYSSQVRIDVLYICGCCCKLRNVLGKGCYMRSGRLRLCILRFCNRRRQQEQEISVDDIHGHVYDCQSMATCALFEPFPRETRTSMGESRSSSIPRTSV